MAVGIFWRNRLMIEEVATYIGVAVSVVEACGYMLTFVELACARLHTPLCQSVVQLVGASLVGGY